MELHLDLLGGGSDDSIQNRGLAGYLSLSELGV